MTLSRVGAVWGRARGSGGEELGDRPGHQGAVGTPEVPGPVLGPAGFLGKTVMEERGGGQVGGTWAEAAHHPCVILTEAPPGAGHV